MPTFPPVLLTGASGFLGRYLQAALAEAGIRFVAMARPDLDLGDARSVDGALGRAGTPLLLHAGAMAVQSACERDPQRAEQVNLHASVALCAQARRWVFVSTDLVFAGDHAPYDETARTAPASVYGKTKAAAEQTLLACGGGLVARLPLLFGPSPSGDRGATDMVRAAARSGRPAKLFTDEFRTPIHARHAARVLVALLLRSDAQGIVHVPGPERIDRYSLGERFVRIAGLPESCIARSLRGEFADAHLRPADTSLKSDRLAQLVAETIPSLAAMLREA